MASPAQALLPRTYRAIAIENPSPGAGDRFGDGLVNGGDVNGDGKDDILVGIDEHGTVEGEVFVFSGADGSLIRRIPPPDPDTSAGPAPDNPAAFGTYVGRMADIGGCPGFTGTPGQNCTATATEIDTTLDGVPEHLATAIGVDVDANGDDMGTAYVLDGATGAVLKRIRMPAAHRSEQIDNQPGASQGPAFGRTILSPSGQPPCAGFGGLAQKIEDDGATTATPCAYGATTAVARGDVDGQDRPDIGIGASDFTEKTATHATCARADGGSALCNQAGRFYVYRGEDLVGRAPDEPLETPFYVIKNPSAQADTNDVNSRFHREAMGYSVAPVGDLGKCPAPPGPGAFCLNATGNNVPDGKPDFVLSSHRSDFAGMGDVGIGYAIDGASGGIMDVYNHPEPQISSIFAFSNYNQPAVGDLGSSTMPDVYLSAMVHNVGHRAQGRGWVLTGDFRSGGANHYEIAVLDDPTPSQIGNFGTSSAGVGDLAGDGRKELAVGAYGPHAPQVIEAVSSDVHIFGPLGEQVLQTIKDPAEQPGSGFGRALAPLGDLNGDGFLDLAVGSGGWDPGAPEICSPCPPTTPAQGRIYLLLSDNSPAPVTPPPALPTGPTGPPGPSGPAGLPAPTLAGRSIELVASRARLRRRGRVALRGQLEVFADARGCLPGQSVEIQRRPPTSPRYRTIARPRTTSSGAFGRRVRVTRTGIFRARARQTGRCLGAVSDGVRVTVRRR